MAVLTMAPVEAVESATPVEPVRTVPAVTNVVVALLIVKLVLSGEEVV